VDEIKKLKDVYDEGKVFWGTAVTSFDQIPQLLIDLDDEDWVGAVTEVDQIFDNLIGQIGGSIQGRHTISGQKAELKALEEKSARGKHHAALGEFALASSRIGGKNPNEVSNEELLQFKIAGLQLKNAAKARFEPQEEAPAQPKPQGDRTLRQTAAGLMESAAPALHDLFAKSLVKILVFGLNAVRKLLKKVIIAAIQATPPDPGDGPDGKKGKLRDRPGWREALGNHITREAATLGPVLANFAVTELDTFAAQGLTKLVTMLVKQKWPGAAQAASGAIDAAIQWLLGYANRELGTARLLQGPISKVLEDLAAEFEQETGLHGPSTAQG
jgi:hypothetical protein